MLFLRRLFNISAPNGREQVTFDVRRGTRYLVTVILTAAAGSWTYADRAPTLREAAAASEYVAVARFTGTYEDGLARFVVENVMKGTEDLTSVAVSVLPAAEDDGSRDADAADFAEGARYLFFGHLENNVLYINGGHEERWRIRRVYVFNGADTIDATVFRKGEGPIRLDLIKTICGEKKPEGSDG